MVSVSSVRRELLGWHSAANQPTRARLIRAERYRVDDVTQDVREDCYLATLHISNTDMHDSRPYYLVVENDRGIDRHAVHLKVEGSFTGALSFWFLC